MPAEGIHVSCEAFLQPVHEPVAVEGRDVGAAGDGDDAGHFITITITTLYFSSYRHVHHIRLVSSYLLEDKNLTAKNAKFAKIISSMLCAFRELL